MKSCLCIACVFIAADAFSQANQHLSNLTSPTQINVDLLPDNNNGHNVGSSGKGWKNIYLNSALYFNGIKYINYQPGNYNTAVGSYVLTANTTGNYNTGLGYNVLSSNTKGIENTAMGYKALYLDTTGNYNTAVGVHALANNSNGYQNTAIGVEALHNNKTGYENTAVGYQALNANTGHSNEAFGYQALFSNTTGYQNTAVGGNALSYNIKGANNAAVGFGALSALSNGDFNTAIGAGSGFNVSAGSSNVFVGNQAGLYAWGTVNNSVAIGAQTFISKSNTVRIGNSNITSIGGFANWVNVSDGRVKKNIKQNVPGLPFINKLQPITYTLDLDVVDKIMAHAERNDAGGKIIQPTADEIASRQAKEKIVYTGFVAQDVERVAKSLNYEFSGVDAAENDHDLYGLRYAEFVVPLVKAVQELSKMNDEKDAKINDLQKQIDELKAILISNVHSISSAQASSNLPLGNLSLEQNVPNPFNYTTTIHYSLPEKFSSAQVIITDKNGRTLKQMNISNGGKGSIVVDATTLASGAYNYSLIIDGNLIATKQMVLTKQ